MSDSLKRVGMVLRRLGEAFLAAGIALCASYGGWMYVNYLRAGGVPRVIAAVLLMALAAYAINDYERSGAS